MRIRCLLAGIVCLATSRGVSRAADAPAPPNIVLIFADDLGWRDLGSMGDGFVETPNLDRLRTQGMSFRNAYAGAANCAPSRACLMSGLYTPRHGVYAVGDTDRGPKKEFRLVPIPNAQGLRPEFVTMAESLRGAGYATGHFGKWHLGNDAKGTGPKNQGFDVSPAELVPAHGDEEDVKQAPTADKRGVMADPKHASAITSAACDFIVTSAAEKRPFFAYLAHHAIHTPLQAKAATLARFRAKAATAKKPHVAALYAACTWELDESVGVLLAKLAELGLEKNTLVIFTSDNGATPAAINEPLRGAKGAYYEAGVREPFFARWPGRIEPGTESDVPIISQDLYPTFLAAAGAQAIPSLDGTNLLPLFEGQPAPPHPAIYWHFPGYLDKPVPRGRDPLFRTRPVTVVRQGDWKLFLYHEEWLLDGGRAALATNHAVELYNLKTDPGEHHDLAQIDPAQRDQLLDTLLAWIDKTDAPLAKRK